jgi:hypothetical protein
LYNKRKSAPGRISSPSQIQKKPELLVAVLCPSNSPLASKSAERKHCEDEEKNATKVKKKERGHKVVKKRREFFGVSNLLL